VIAKRDLIDRVWPNTFVEESNLKARLRRYAGPWETAATVGDFSFQRSDEAMLLFFQ